jgi:hypothetical protein
MAPHEMRERRTITRLSEPHPVALVRLPVSHRDKRSAKLKVPAMAKR